MKSMKKILFILLIVLTANFFSSVVRAEELQIKLKNTDKDKNLCDTFYAGPDKRINIMDLNQYWNNVAEEKGNFVWYKYFKETESTVFYYYPKVIATIPGDWIWNDSPLKAAGGGSFNSIASTSILKREITDSFYGNTIAQYSINLEIKDMKSKEDIERLQFLYDDYTRAGTNLAGLKGDKYTNYSRDAFPSINIEDTVYILYSNSYIYKITIEIQIDSRFEINNIPETREIEEIIKSMIIIEK